VLTHVLAFRRHLRIQLEWLEMDLGVHLAIEFRQRLLQRGQPDRAPRTGHIGDEIDAQRFGLSRHGRPSDR